MDRARQFREAAAHLNRDRGKTGWRYPDSLRAIAVEHCREQRRAQLSFSRIATELGVSTVTLGRWIERAETLPSSEDERAAFRQVVIEPERLANTNGLALVLPSGLRIEGLGVDDALELVRGLA
jgi:DNA-binding transcriptional regulator YiaG